VVRTRAEGRVKETEGGVNRRISAGCCKEGGWDGFIKLNLKNQRQKIKKGRCVRRIWLTGRGRNNSTKTQGGRRKKKREKLRPGPPKKKRKRQGDRG